LTQFVSPDDEHDVLETYREFKIKVSTQKGIVHHVGHLPRITTGVSPKQIVSCNI